MFLILGCFGVAVRLVSPMICLVVSILSFGFVFCSAADLDSTRNASHVDEVKASGSYYSEGSENRTSVDAKAE